MFKNYFKTAWRNLIKDKQFSFLNLLGLATGLARALLIYLWVSDELSVDKFNTNDSQLYQVMKTSPTGDGGTITFPSTPGLLAQSMKKDLPEVEYASSARPEEEKGILATNEKSIKASSEYVDGNFFNIFSYKILDGNVNSFQSNKYGVLLSDKVARKLFNTTQNLTGKIILWNRGEFTGSYVVSGVFQSPPDNATDQFDLFFNYAMYSSKEAEDIANWGSNGQN
ncbi:MAG: ABC transporter permease, partial [Ginsengibacter sp.]